MAMVMTMSLTMSADDDDRVITYDQLPQTAQTFLKANFATKVPPAGDRRLGRFHHPLRER